MKAKVIYGKVNRYFANDQEVTRAEFDELFPTKINDLLKKRKPQQTLMQTSKAWPRLSDSMAVHPDQIGEAQEMMREKGVPTEYAKDGRMIVRNNAHQRDVQKALGYINRDAGYGEVTG